MAANNSYSQFVMWAKIILPLSALGLLSSLFFLSQEIDPEAAIPFADVDVNELIREQGITAPTYTGMTRDGSAVDVVADTAKPDLHNPAISRAVNVVAQINTRDGVVIDITSRAGVMDTDAQLVDLTGDVRAVTSTGYVLESENLISALDKTEIISPIDVLVTGAFGQITAGNMRFSEDIKAEGAYLLVFKGGVNLIYDPQNEAKNE